MFRYYDSAQKIRNQLLLFTRKVQISLGFFRSYECVEKCCACCLKFSLDYFEGRRWEELKKNYPKKIKYFKKRLLDGVIIYSDFQKDNKSYFCRFLNVTTGKCMIHKYNPFSCAFELIKISKWKDSVILIKKKYSRGWIMTRLDGKKGALCKILPFNYKQFLKDLELLKELNEIGNQFKIKTELLTIINFLETNKNSFEKGTLLSENEHWGRPDRKKLLVQNFFKIK